MVRFLFVQDQKSISAPKYWGKHDAGQDIGNNVGGDKVPGQNAGGTVCGEMKHWANKDGGRVRKWQSSWLSGPRTRIEGSGDEQPRQLMASDASEFMESSRSPTRPEGVFENPYQHS